MASYSKDTGASGTMKIVDSGGKVEFWLKANSSTYNYQLPWGYTVNGNTDNTNEFRFEKGGDWQKLKTWTVSSSQTVTFRLKDTGTNSLGGPTTFSVAIKRATAPDAPARPTASSITSSSVYIKFTDGDDNGDDINSRQIGWSKSSTGSPTSTVSSDKSTTVTGLASGTKYYFRARTHNSEGYSPWSSAVSVTTLDEPAAPGIVQVSSITQTSVVATFKDPSDVGGSPILERQLGLGGVRFVIDELVILPVTSTYKYTPPSTVVNNLTPGVTYYIRSRTRNAIGWSDWSTPTSFKTLAGVYIKVGGVWKKAVPYVKVNGVWRIVRPWGRQYGYWEETT